MCVFVAGRTHVAMAARPAGANPPGKSIDPFSLFFNLLPSPSSLYPLGLASPLSHSQVKSNPSFLAIWRLFSVRVRKIPAFSLLPPNTATPHPSLPGPLPCIRDGVTSALKIKLKPRREPLPVSTASQNQNPSSAQQQSIALQQQTNSTHQKSEEDSRAGGYKRKFPSPTSSPVSKRIFREDSPLSGESLEIFPALAGLPEVLPERFEQLSAEPLVIKHRLGHHHASIAALIQREQQGRVEDEDTRSSRLRSSAITLENISHGQLQVISVVPCSITGPRLAISSQDDMGQSDSVMRASIDAAVSQQIYPFASWTRPDPQPSKGHNVAIIPTHASWFAWDRIHKLERQAMPQFFYGKSKLQSAETFMQARNAIIMKCRLNPQTPISLLDIRGLSDLGDKELAQILEFLVQWGLVNYQAELNSETSGFKYPTKVPVYLIEDGSGLLSSSQLSLTPLEYLYQYEPLQAPGMALKNLAFDEETSSVVPENVVKEASGTVLSGTSENFCSACAGDCSQRHFYCEKQADYIVCPDCYGNGKLGIGMTTTDFVPFDGYPEASDVFDSGNWSDQETLMLLEALEIHGDNWTEVSEFVGTKSKAQCISHFIGLSIEDRFFEDMEVPRSFTTVRTRHTDLHQPLISQEEHSTNLIDLEAKVPVGSDKPGLIMNPKTLGELQGEPEVHAAFEGAANPVMSLVAFLAATVGPRVAAVAAHSALSSLAEEYQAIQVAADKRDQNMPANSTGPTDIGFEKTTNSDSATDKGGAREKSNPEAPHVPDGHQLYLSKDSMRKVTSAALATAAMKAKLLADQEEREVQRLAAIIVDNQLKKLSVKLKQLGDIDSVLEKEREQIERNRQRLSTDRIRFMSTHLGPTAPTPQMPIPGNPNPMNTRPTGPLSGSGVAPAVMPTGAVMPALHPSHMLRPGLYTIGSSGMAMPVSASMVKPPS